MKRKHQRPEPDTDLDKGERINAVLDQLRAPQVGDELASDLWELVKMHKNGELRPNR